MNSRDIMLARIRGALETDASGGAPAGEHAGIERRYRRALGLPIEAVVAEFEQRVGEYRANVRRVRSADLPNAIADACDRHRVRTLVVPHDLPPQWLPPAALSPVLSILRDGPTAALTNAELDASDGVLTGCALGISQTGTIVLDAGAAQGRRAITLLPDYHLCVVFEDQIVALVPEGIARLTDTVQRTRRPVTLISGPSATSDIELNRVEGVHGPRRLEVLLVS